MEENTPIDLALHHTSISNGTKIKRISRNKSISHNDRDDDDDDDGSTSSRSKRSRGRPKGSKNDCQAEKLFRCEVSGCHTRYKTKQGLVYHHKHRHAPDLIRKDFVCPVCGNRFENKTRLRIHSRLHQQEQSSKSKNKFAAVEKAEFLPSMNDFSNQSFPLPLQHKQQQQPQQQPQQQQQQLPRPRPQPQQQQKLQQQHQQKQQQQQRQQEQQQRQQEQQRQQVKQQQQQQQQRQQQQLNDLNGLPMPSSMVFPLPMSHLTAVSKATMVGGWGMPQALTIQDHLQQNLLSSLSEQQNIMFMSSDNHSNNSHNHNHSNIDFSAIDPFDHHSWSPSSPMPSGIQQHQQLQQQQQQQPQQQQSHLQLQQHLDANNLLTTDLTIREFNFSDQLESATCDGSLHQQLQQHEEHQRRLEEQNKLLLHLLQHQQKLLHAGSQPDQNNFAVGGRS